MKIASVKPADLVRCDRLGRQFWARVERREGRALAITPVSRNISYHRATSREVLEHYAHRPQPTGKVSTRSIRAEDIVAYRHDGDTAYAIVLTRRRARLHVFPITSPGGARDLPTREVTGHYARRGRSRP